MSSLKEQLEALESNPISQAAKIADAIGAWKKFEPGIPIILDALDPAATPATPKPTFHSSFIQSLKYMVTGNNMKVRYSFSQTGAGTKGSASPALAVYGIALPPQYNYLDPVNTSVGKGYMTSTLLAVGSDLGIATLFPDQKVFALNKIRGGVFYSIGSETTLPGFDDPGFVLSYDLDLHVEPV
jgi:hypothetical protein